MQPIHIDGASTVPIFQQLVKAIECLVVGSALSPGERLPSVRDLAVQCHVNPNTVSKAYQVLQSRGLIEIDRGIGLRVAQLPAEILTAHRTQLLQTEIDQLFIIAKNLNISSKELFECVKKTEARMSKRNQNE